MQVLLASVTTIEDIMILMLKHIIYAYMCAYAYTYEWDDSSLCLILNLCTDSVILQ